AEDGVRAIKVTYETKPHWVDEEDLAGATKAMRTKPLGDNQKGEVDAALKAAKHVHTGYYGIATISHMCLETHGSHCEWNGEDKLNVHLSTQNVSGTGGQFAGPLGLDASNVSITCNYIGGGFGSKFAADEWGLACAQLSKKAGKPVRLMLDRATELKIGGTRPSGFAKVTIAADAEGNITVWDSHHWGTSGIAGSTIALGQLPYCFDGIPNRNRKATGISTNTGPNRAWRAPPHPQLCAVTDTVIDDLAAKMGANSYDIFLKNLDKTKKPDVYAEEMKIGAKLIDWKAKWHAHGKGGGGAQKRGLGMALHQWGGRAGATTCTVKVHPDGAVETFLGSQDLGTGTRTVIAITLAETFGLGVADVKVNLGNNSYPKANPSGGSITVGGVTGPHRRAGLEALWKIYDLVAAKYKVAADTLSAKGGKILSAGKAVCTWKQACGLLGGMALEVQGQGPKNDGLTSQGVAGIQMADVTVDIETGIVKVNELVAVQDCGLIIDELTARSQVYGGLIMGIAYAISEERVMDNRTGRFINADLENYKLPRIGDIGKLKVHMYQPDSEYERGVVGLGEPPVISTGAAISNAVANATGVRVPVQPLTPQRVLEALKGGQA
ncbi:MAG: molybdopterin cofactor-binding domain-containing protein, partial [Planctomycetota bacterium]|nr:molybdopterin cofactor-binding domain-containing protein [Planctomycetota bacterium]